MNEPVWVRRDVVRALHERLLAEHGGSPGLRDGSLLDSALDRPGNLFAYGPTGWFELAAAYAFGIVKNHPFVDGNKRLGCVTAFLFLELNGFRVTAASVEVVLRTLALAAGELTEAGYAAWLEANSEPAARAGD